MADRHGDWAWRPPLTVGMISFAFKKPLTQKENADGLVYRIGRPCVKRHCCRYRIQRPKIAMSGAGKQCHSCDQLPGNIPMNRRLIFEEGTHSNWLYEVWPLMFRRSSKLPRARHRPSGSRSGSGGGWSGCPRFFRWLKFGGDVKLRIGYYGSLNLYLLGCESQPVTVAVFVWQQIPYSSRWSFSIIGIAQFR